MCNTFDTTCMTSRKRDAQQLGHVYGPSFTLLLTTTNQELMSPVKANLKNLCLFLWNACVLCLPCWTTLRCMTMDVKLNIALDWICWIVINNRTCNNFQCKQGDLVDANNNMISPALEKIFIRCRVPTGVPQVT